MALLRLTNIHKHFGGVKALKGVSFELLAGEVHAIVGENGAGKSTLIKVIAGAHRPDEGAIEVDGQTVERLDPKLSRRLGIAVIYQQPALFPDLSVAENMALRLESGGPWRVLNWRERHRRAGELLSRVGAVIAPTTLVRELSMPQQQLVEIASALGGGARVLILDEPTASLSQREVEHLFQIVRELRSQGVGLVYISHRLEELSEIADRVTVLRDGAYVGTEPMAGVDRSRLIRLMVGRDVSSVYPKKSVRLGDVVLETDHLGCSASGVRGINLSVRAGEIVGIAGLVGAGRTELARVLFGLTPADSGRIVLHSEEVTVRSPSEAVRLGIAYVPEDRRRDGVVLDLPVSTNTTLAVLRQISVGGLLNLRKERAIAEGFVRQLGIKTSSIDTPAGQLSGGNQQKVALARWLATNPSLLILDEPTQGVDVGAKAEIHRLMGELASDGLAILMISSELPEVLGMSDRILVMHGGEIVGEMARAEATQEKLLELALGSRSAATGEATPSGRTP